MLSRRQQILIKRAQAETGLADADYRASLGAVTGMLDCRSSKDPRLTDAHMDHLLSYFEAIYWRENSAPAKVFKQPGFWAARNRRGNTSRDRFTEDTLTLSIARAESKIMQLGFGEPYLEAIQNKILPYTHRAYLAALERTLKAKRNRVAKADLPF